MKKCMILGVNGQDGSYAAEEFLEKGYRVFGIGRQDKSRWVQSRPGFNYIQIDLTDLAAYQNVLSEVAPDVLCLFAALHGSAGFVYEDHWHASLTVNGLITQASLEYLRTVCPESSLYYLSSSKVFASGVSAQVSESSPRFPNCLYSIAKNLSTDLIHYYRNQFGTKGSIVWTFNHESPRRSGHYFIPIIVRALAHGLRGDAKREQIETLDFWCDWGSAQEFMGIVADLADRGIADDFILATGRLVSARDFVEGLFSRFNLRASDFLDVRTPSRPRDVAPCCADISKLREKIGRRPVKTIEDVCLDILRENHLQPYAQTQE